MHRNHFSRPTLKTGRALIVEATLLSAGPGLAQTGSRISQHTTSSFALTGGGTLAAWWEIHPA